MTDLPSDFKVVSEMDTWKEKIKPKNTPKFISFSARIGFLVRTIMKFTQ